MSQEERLKLEKIRLLEERLRLKQGLPYKYGFKRYPWQQEYCDNKTNKKRLVCAANQIGKSTIQICDRIDIATDPSLWKMLWPEQHKHNPNMKPYSWYLYPNQDTVMAEFETKWMPYYLPAGDFKDHIQYGWTYKINNKVLKYIEFGTGYRIYFKTYNQNAQDLQSGTVFAVDCDEELPEELLPELQARLFATNGYFSMAFTATIGQEFWWRVIEGNGDEELWKDAWKCQVSMYDCLRYTDGSETPWSKNRIQIAERNCKDKREVQRRIYGRFVKDSGLKYPSFNREINLRPFPKDSNGKYFKGVPKGWSVYSGVDIGSGGDNHPAAYSFLAVSPDYTKIRWIRGRRLDGIETTAGDIYNFYRDTRGKIACTSQVYDSAAKDFGTITTRAGEPFKKAQKSHEEGELALSTALKAGMFVIYYDPEDPLDEAIKLAREFETLSTTTNKRIAKDDFIDSVRYAIMEVPIDWDKILNGEEQIIMVEPKDGSPQKERPNDYIWGNKKDEKDHKDICSEEFDFWTDLY